MHRRSKRILTVLALLSIVFGVLYAVALGRSTARLRRAYAALEADGRPTRAADILPPKVAASDNAAVLYQSAVLLLKGQPAGDKSLFEQLTSRAARTSRESRQEWIGHEAVTKALSLVAEGTHRPACRLEHDPGSVLEVMDPPALEDLRNLASILTARARFEAEDGRPARAWDLLVTQLRFADSLRGDPSSRTQFVRLVQTVWAARTMRWLCETALPAPEQAQAIEDLLRRQDDLEPLLQAADGERLLIGEWFFNLSRQELDKILWKEREQNKNNVVPASLVRAEHRILFLVLAFKPRLVTDHATYLEVMRRRVQVLQGPYRDRRQLDEITQWSLWNVLTHKLTWSALNEKYFYSRLQADARVTRAGLALLQHRQVHGTFPPTLETLGLEELTDPFTEGPLHYRTEGEGFVVYSVGEDMKDNDGTPQRRREDSDPRRKPIEYDQVWRFPDPEHRAAQDAD
ncbi:MAG: hypothetical protein FJ280_04125 [Planctomycetes bacterium]|nr:hypothetical protein [Planctomycetota bacterium]